MDWINRLLRILQSKKAIQCWFVVNMIKLYHNCQNRNKCLLNQKSKVKYKLQDRMKGYSCLKINLN